jgi:hypothetical protein
LVTKVCLHFQDMGAIINTSYRPGLIFRLELYQLNTMFYILSKRNFKGVTLGFFTLTLILSHQGRGKQGRFTLWVLLQIPFYLTRYPESSPNKPLFRLDYHSFTTRFYSFYHSFLTTLTQKPASIYQILALFLVTRFKISAEV